MEKGKGRGYEDAMKKLLKPYNVSIEVNSADTISNENWIAIVNGEDMKNDTANNSLSLKEANVAFERALSKDGRAPINFKPVSPITNPSVPSFSFGDEKKSESIPLLAYSAAEPADLGASDYDIGIKEDDDDIFEDIQSLQQSQIAPQHDPSVATPVPVTESIMTDTTHIAVPKDIVPFCDGKQNMDENANQKMRSTETAFQPTQQMLDELWDSLYTEDIPLFRLNAVQFWGSIGMWIKNDVRYQKVLEQLKRVCREKGISGSLISFVYHKATEGVTLIEDALKTEMNRYFTGKTMDIILDGLKEWIQSVRTERLQHVHMTTDEIAENMTKMPIVNLKNEIINKQIDGKRFIENPDEFGETVQRVTGWTKSECDLLRKTMERRISLTADQFIKKVETRAAEKGFTPMIITKMKNRLSSNRNLEDAHYELRTKGTVHVEFSESVLNLLSDIMAEQKENEIDDEDQFVVDYFDILSSVSLMMKVDGDGNEVNGPYICPCCGHLNVIKIVEYRYRDNLPMCSLCGVAAKEAVSMTLKRVPLPYVNHEAYVTRKLSDRWEKVEDIALYYPDTVIQSEPLRWAQNKRMDLHCALQKDSNLCPVLQRVAMILDAQMRYLTLFDGRRKTIYLSQNDLSQFISLEVYKETFLISAEDILSSKQPTIKDEAMRSLRALLEDEKHPVCDFAKYLSGGGGPRKEFVKILKDTTGMKRVIAHKIFRSVIGQMRTEQYRLWLQTLHIENINSDRQHIMQHHLHNASQSKKEVISSFFHDALDSHRKLYQPDEWNEFCKNKIFPTEPIEDELNHFRLELLNCGDGKDDEVVEEKLVVISPAADEAEMQGCWSWKFITDPQDVPKFSLGIPMNYLSLKPCFRSIREELRDCSTVRFVAILLKTIKKYHSVTMNNAIFNVSREYAEKHGISRNQYISMKHLMAIILYTDCTQFSKLLQFTAVRENYKFLLFLRNS